MKINRFVAFTVLISLCATIVLSGCFKENKEDEVKESSTLNIAMLINGTLNDSSIFDCANDGAKMIKRDYKAKVDVIEMGYDEAKWEPTLVEYSQNSGYDIIIVGTRQMADILANVAKQFPEKKYIVFDASVDGCENVYSMEYKQNESSYLAGAVAASLSASGIIGFIGGAENVTTNDAMVGYISGAKEINPEIKVAVSYVGGYDNTEKATDLATEQMDSGADIIYSAAGGSGMGVIDAAADNGRFVIGSYIDQALALMDTDINKASCVATSAFKRIDISLQRAIALHLDGKLAYGSKEVLGLDGDFVGITDNDVYTTTLPEEARTKIDKLKADIIAGTITVDTAFDKQAAEIQDIINSVAP